MTMVIMSRTSPGAARYWPPLTGCTLRRVVGPVLCKFNCTLSALECVVWMCACVCVVCVRRMSVCGRVCEAALSSVGLGYGRLIRCQWLPAWRESLMYRGVFSLPQSPSPRQPLLGFIQREKYLLQCGRERPAPLASWEEQRGFP